MASRMQKMPRQPMTSVRAPPTIGAVTGATPLMAPMTASMRASSAPVKRSAATEREMTMPPAPAMPCSRRSRMNCRMSEAKMQRMVETMKSAMAAISGGRRP